MWVGYVFFSDAFMSSITQSLTPLEFHSELVEKTCALFPSSNLTFHLTHSKATSAYDAVWTIASVWSYLLSASLCDNDTQLTKEVEQTLDAISVRTSLHTQYNDYLKQYSWDICANR